MDSLIDAIADLNNAQVSKILTPRRAKRLRKAIKKTLGIDIGFDPTEGFVDLGHEVYVTDWHWDFSTPCWSIRLRHGTYPAAWVCNSQQLAEYLADCRLKLTTDIYDEHGLIQERIENYRQVMKELESDNQEKK
jgi:hypothetical protein